MQHAVCFSTALGQRRQRTEGAGGSKVEEHPVVQLVTLQDVGGLDIAVRVARLMKHVQYFEHLP